MYETGLLLVFISHMINKYLNTTLLIIINSKIRNKEPTMCQCEDDINNLKKQM